MMTQSTLDDKCIEVQQLMSVAPQLQFELTSPLPGDRPCGGEITVSGWMITTDSNSCLTVESGGHTRTYPMGTVTASGEAPQGVQPQTTLVRFRFEFSHVLPASDVGPYGRIRLGVTMHGVWYWIFALTMERQKPKGILLGGSNSVALGGLWDGLKKILPEMVNASAGASSSLQNLFELIRHGALAGQADFVITESNVNDAVIAHKLNREKEVLENINWLYHELNLFDVPVYIILLPLMSEMAVPGNPALVDAVNACHRENANRYGFHIIDVAQRFSLFRNGQIEMVMNDALHPLRVYMFHLGQNLARHLAENRQRETLPEADWQPSLQHEVYLFDEYEAQKVQKVNTRFDEQVLSVDRPMSLCGHLDGKRLAGIATWSDDYSSISLTNSQTRVVKRFTPFMAFSEIWETFIIDRCSQIDSNYRLPETEKSLDVPADARLTSPVKLLGLLVRKRDAAPVTETTVRGAFSLPEVIPEIGPYFFTVDSLFKSRKALRGSGKTGLLKKLLIRK
ncbi:MAG: SGNH/GDSL hydrolase family protein [Deltaproteobacteria bacterium]|nr:SGNH/GDSL hydrolase family protein [Deltaproteobacteria bacterium]